MLFKIFVGIIGFIALTLAFFLLMVSTTQNVKDNVWEYGCLRAMGLTKAQGMKMFMIEQYSLILSSLFLGTTCGLLLACVETTPHPPNRTPARNPPETDPAAWPW